MARAWRQWSRTNGRHAAIKDEQYEPLKPNRAPDRQKQRYEELKDGSHSNVEQPSSIPSNQNIQALHRKELFTVTITATAAFGEHMDNHIINGHIPDE